MEAKVQGMQLPRWTSAGKIATKPTNSLQFVHKYGEQRSYRIPSSCHLLIKKGKSGRPLVLKVSCSSEKNQVSVLESGNAPASLDESKTIETKSEEIEPHLNGRCIYLVGMMGSGKTTVGKVLSEALEYSFCDCDTLIEEAVGVKTVAEIFKLHGEGFFRDNETEVLQKLSAMHRLVISTGGGAVIRPINWKHMQKGISVWLDVPLEALARRITAVGTDSRPLLNQGSGPLLNQGSGPLLNQGSGDPYLRTIKRLSTLFEERGESYANADVRVSLENIAAKLELEDVCNLTPTIIAIEVLQNIGTFLRKKKY